MSRHKNSDIHSEMGGEVIESREDRESEEEEGKEKSSKASPPQVV
jgi:hypothetical protein